MPLRVSKYVPRQLRSLRRSEGKARQCASAARPTLHARTHARTRTHTQITRTHASHSRGQARIPSAPDIVVHARKPRRLAAHERHHRTRIGRSVGDLFAREAELRERRQLVRSRLLHSGAGRRGRWLAYGLRVSV